MKGKATKGLTIIFEERQYVRDTRGFIYEANLDRETTGYASTLKEASEKTLAYIKRYNIGGSCFSEAKVYYDGNLIAEISFNGRVWDPSGGTNPFGVHYKEFTGEALFKDYTK